MSSADNYRRQAAILAKAYRGDYGALQRDAAQAASDARKSSVTVTELLTWRRQRRPTAALGSVRALVTQGSGE